MIQIDSKFLDTTRLRKVLAKMAKATSKIFQQPIHMFPQLSPTHSEVKKSTALMRERYSTRKG